MRDGFGHLGKRRSGLHHLILLATTIRISGYQPLHEVGQLFHAQRQIRNWGMNVCEVITSVTLSVRTGIGVGRRVRPGDHHDSRALKNSVTRSKKAKKTIRKGREGMGKLSLKLKKGEE